MYSTGRRLATNLRLRQRCPNDARFKDNQASLSLTQGNRAKPCFSEDTARLGTVLSFIKARKLDAAAHCELVKYLLCARIYCANVR